MASTFRCDRIQQALVDLVADKRRLEGNRRRPASGGSQGREVAIQNCLRRTVTEGIRRRYLLIGSLIPAEEEQLVLDNWTAQHAAKLVAFQTVCEPLPVGSRRPETICGVELVVAHKPECIAVDLVGARLGHAVDSTTRVVAEIGRQSTGLHLELTQSIRKRHRQARVSIGVHVETAIQVVRGCGRLPSRNRVSDCGRVCLVT